RIFGRDTFWSTPHLFIYVGVALWGMAALVATATAMAGRPIRGRPFVLGPLRAELGLALIGVGALVTILAGPFDNLWHSVFGSDVDIWSPPHIAGIVGGAIGLLGWLAATAPGVFPIDERMRRLLRLFTLGNLIAISVFALNFYYITSVTREAFFYPLLVSALVPATLAIATVAIPGRWAAPPRGLLPVLRADRRATVAFTLAAGGSPPRSATRGGELDRGKAHCGGASGRSPLRGLRSLVATPTAGRVRSAAGRRVASAPP